MLALKLAYKNLMGAGLRTWLNVAVLSFAFVLIVFYNGMIDGWNRQAQRDTKAWEIGAGQYWHPAYDNYDPYTIEDSHQPISEEAKKLISEDKITPILITQATAYPQGRVQSIVLKGIDPNQKILRLPSADLAHAQDGQSALIGKRMAQASKLKVGDQLLIRWRDKNGVFDAREIKIAAIFSCDVPTVDQGQIYIPLEVLQEMTNMNNEATLFVASQDSELSDIEGWDFKDTKFLLTDFEKIIQSKKGSGLFLQGLLLIIALLAIFDTQVLSIFRRQKEIGTYIALGLTRRQVVGIFTVEGGAHSILAALVGAVWGIPFLMYIDSIGLSMASSTADMGITLADTIYPYYSFGLIITTIIIVVITSTIVSYMPARKISKMNPTDALKGKLQ